MFRTDSSFTWTNSHSHNSQAMSNEGCFFVDLDTFVLRLSQLVFHNPMIAASVRVCEEQKQGEPTFDSRRMLHRHFVSPVPSNFVAVSPRGTPVPSDATSGSFSDGITPCVNRARSHSSRVQRANADPDLFWGKFPLPCVKQIPLKPV